MPSGCNQCNRHNILALVACLFILLVLFICLLLVMELFFLGFLVATITCYFLKLGHNNHGPNTGRIIRGPLMDRNMGRKQARMGIVCLWADHNGPLIGRCVQQT